MYKYNIDSHTRYKTYWLVVLLCNLESKEFGIDYFSLSLLFINSKGTNNLYLVLVTSSEISDIETVYVAKKVPIQSGRFRLGLNFMLSSLLLRCGMHMFTVPDWEKKSAFGMTLLERRHWNSCRSALNLWSSLWLWCISLI